MVNAEHGNAPGRLSPDAWNVLMTVAVLLVWQAPTERFRRWRPLMMAVGVASLVALAFLFRSTRRGRHRPAPAAVVGHPGPDWLVVSRGVARLSSWSAIGRSSSLPRCVLSTASSSPMPSGRSAALPYLSVGSTLGSHAALVVSGAVVTALLTALSGPWRRAGTHSAGTRSATARC